MRTRFVVAVMVGTVAFVACGGGDSAPIDLGTLPPEPATTTAATTAPTLAAPTVPTTAAPVTTAPVRSWTPATANLVGLPSECGNMSYVTSRPDRDVLIAGIAQQGLWASTDGAASWTQLGQAPGSARILNRTSMIVFDPDTASTFWQSGIYGDGGVYRTDDDGASFVKLDDTTGSDHVSVDLTDPQRRTLLAMRHETSIVIRSTDGGATWQDVSGGLPDGVGQAIAPHVIDAQTYLLGSKSGGAPGVFRTTDGGVTWTRVHEGGISGAPVVASTDGAIFWLVENGGAIIRSDDAGQTWTQIPAPVGKYATSLLELPDGRLATYGDFVAVSDEARATFTTVGPQIPYGANGMAYSPFRKAFYVWRFDCSQTTANPIVADSILQVPFDFEVE